MISELTKVPMGWEKVKFGDIAQNITDRTDNPKESGLKDYIGLEHLDTDEIRIKRYGLPDEVEATKFLCRKGDIIFGKRRAYLRKLAVTSRDAVVSAHSMVLRPKEEKVIPDFLPWLMQSSQFWKTAFAISEGSLSPTIKWKTLSAQEFWIPSRTEQKKIAEILWSIESSVKKLEQLIQVTEKLKEAIILEMLGISGKYGKFMHPRMEGTPAGWAVRKVEDLIESTQNGFPSGKRDENGIVQIRMNNVSTDGQLLFDNYLKVPIPENILKYSLEDGDILFNNTNSVDLVGKSAIFTKQKFNCTFSNHFTRIRVKKDIILPEILHQHLIVWQNKGYFQDIAQRQVGQSGVSIKDILGIEIFVPTKGEQEFFVNVMKNIDDFLGGLNRHRDFSRKLRKKLTNSFLSGELLVQKEGMD